MSSVSLEETKKAINNIKTIIKNIEMRGITTPPAKEDYFWNNHADLMNRYTFLISQLCSNSDSHSHMLDIMLSQLEKIEHGKKLDDADKDIGKILADNYLPK
jgi:hypothetical protein